MISTRLKIHTLLLVDQEMGVGVDADDDQVGDNVASSDHVHHVGIIHWDLFRDLHHPKDDDQVGSASSRSIRSSARLGRVAYICGETILEEESTWLAGDAVESIEEEEEGN